MFGTDGVRGVANKDLTCTMAYRLGQAAVAFMGKTILVGKDTRLSGDMLEAAVCAGITSMGGTALTTGVLPTPGIALLTRQLHASGGIVISASHNPPEYNGIKYFDAEGFKLRNVMEDAIEEFVTAGGAQVPDMPNGDEVGIILPVEDAVELYIQHAVSVVEEQGISFDGLKIALDCGHGASALTSAEALERLGAEVFAINQDFCGTDINVKCGSTNLGPVKDLVRATGADVGIAHDGDADRVMMVTSEGVEVDGDMMEAVLALDLKERGLLEGNTAVSTVMCNLGFVRAMEVAGIQVHQTKVGDRYVLGAMREHGFAIGGEQSGHMIMLAHNTTGDGLMTAVQFLAACVRAGKSVDDAVKVMERFPQELINVRVADKHAVSENQAVAAAVAAAEEAMGATGRVLLRPSGTEPLVRVMVEAASQEDAEAHARAIAAVVQEQLGL